MKPDALPVNSVEPKIQRYRITVRGIVQGVGFRPFVTRLAAELSLGGHCGNDDASVFIEVEGPAGTLEEFVERLRTQAPPMSVVLDIIRERLSARGESGFRIVDSRRADGARTLVSPDVATCDDCLREFADSRDRRHRHPFINCTNCGPRFTVIRDLPYDRPATTMAPFEMCAACRREYTTPEDRRYHAQPISCHDCGPHIFAELDGRRINGDDRVLEALQRVLAGGGIAAVKGLGGFHLVCDARNRDAVARLRERKRRPAKPFALMVPDLATAQQVCTVSAAESKLLERPSRPIVLLRKRVPDAVAPHVAPGIDDLGVMLPYTPLHHLLFMPVPGLDGEPPQLLVMTSGNLSGEPLCFDNDDARRRLGAIADLFLLHDRDIAVPCEDSVLAVDDDRELPIRRSRGYAPLPVLLPGSGPVVLGVGAEVKNTFCLTRQDYAFCSAHLGDLGSLESLRAYETSIAQLTGLHRVTPELVVADEHPGYVSRHWAERYSESTGVPMRTVQHHHAHVASLMAEHGLLGTRLLGVAFDGTGYSCDRTVWGGELLSVGPDVLSVRRSGHLQSFLLPGGDVAVRTPARVALALLHECGISDVDDLPCTRALGEAEHALVVSQLASGVSCVRTTSVGRLFDGVSSLLDIRHRITYEAQAAVELETLALRASRAAPLAVDIDGGRLCLPRLLTGILAGVRAGVPAAELALGFHRALADSTAALAARIGERNGIRAVGLTGGVFQNRLLLGMVRASLISGGFEVYTHHRVPANDGGLSLGQAALGTALVRRAPRPAASDEPGIGAMQ